MDVYGKSPDYKDALGIKNQKDTGLQIILSAVIGLSAFLGFCVSFTFEALPIPVLIASSALTTKMEVLVRSPKEAAERSVAFAGASQYVLRMDTSHIQDYRATSLGFCWSRRLRGQSTSMVNDRASFANARLPVPTLL